MSHRIKTAGSVAASCATRFFQRCKLTRSVEFVPSLVHAISEDAKRFYKRHGFVESQIDPMTLMITVAEAKRAIGAG